MKVIFDIDGTLTEFEDFVLAHANEYMKKNYAMKPVNYDGYDLDQVYALQDYYIKQGSSYEEAAALSNEAMGKFWEMKYLNYILTPFKAGAKETINKIVDKDIPVEFCTSRRKATEDNFKGKFVKNTIYLQLLLNLGIRPNLKKFAGDEEKTNYILAHDNHLVLVDDKPELLQSIANSDNIDGICIDSAYNRNFSLPSKVIRAKSYLNSEVYDAVMSFREREDKILLKRNKY